MDTKKFKETTSLEASAAFTAETKEPVPEGVVVFEDDGEF